MNLTNVLHSEYNIYIYDVYAYKRVEPTVASRQDLTRNSLDSHKNKNYHPPNSTHSPSQTKGPYRSSEFAGWQVFFTSVATLGPTSTHMWVLRVIHVFQKNLSIVRSQN